MRLLLDTHIAIWSVSDKQRLPPEVVGWIADRGNDIFFSIVTLWEVAVKNAPGRRHKMPMSVVDASLRFTEFGYSLLPLEPAHILAAEGLPPIHYDPFDRMLIAQARVEQLQLLTQDAELGAYGKSVLLF